MRFLKQSLQESSDAKFFESALQEQAGRVAAPIGELRRKTAARETGSKKRTGSGKRKKDAA